MCRACAWQGEGGTVCILVLSAIGLVLGWGVTAPQAQPSCLLCKHTHSVTVQELSS